MPKFEVFDEDYVTVTDENNKSIKLLNSIVYDEFELPVLGLGEFEREAQSRRAIAAVFDLKGFTSLSDRADAELILPVFIRRFLHWMMEQIKSEMTQKQFAEGVRLYAPLPFLVKFMGDGILVLWDVEGKNETQIDNIVYSAYLVCQKYKSEFLSSINSIVSEPPKVLRCGLAQGRVYAVGDGNDYVGPCINMAARLEKIGGATFAFSRKGFDIENSKVPFLLDDIVIKKIKVRGISNKELVGFLKSELNLLEDIELSEP